MKKSTACLVLALAALVAAPSWAQEHGGGGGGCGDVFGDLIHVARDATTGVPILAQRWVELPAEIKGYGWGYCPIALDAAGNELPFLPYTCDVDVSAGIPVEVDYFGRLSAGRTKERNQRMHFNEVVSNIKLADRVGVEETGRLKLGTCTTEDVQACEWNVIDSPMENMALYHRIMKYGHIQTDPNEPNLWWHGDPKLEPPMHPALDANDWAKFDPALSSILPRERADECFDDEGTFDTHCSENQPVKKGDFNVVVAFLGGAAGKEGRITVDLVQYLNRILKITLDTTVKDDGVTPSPDGGTKPTVDQLPALVRDCWPSNQNPLDPPETLPDGEVLTDPPYLPKERCMLVAARPTALPNYDLSYEVQEKFVNFKNANYNRQAAFGNGTGSKTMPLLKPAGDGTWIGDPAVPLIPWLEDANPRGNRGKDVDGFVKAASDALRAIQFVHNYTIPEDLWGFDY